MGLGRGEGGQISLDGKRRKMRTLGGGCCWGGGLHTREGGGIEGQFKSTDRNKNTATTHLGRRAAFNSSEKSRSKKKAKGKRKGGGESAA